MMRGLLGVDDCKSSGSMPSAVTDMGVDLVIVSMVLSIAFAGLSAHLKNLGCGLHMWDMKYADYTPPYLAVRSPIWTEMM